MSKFSNLLKIPVTRQAWPCLLPELTEVGLPTPFALVERLLEISHSLDLVLLEFFQANSRRQLSGVLIA